MTEAEKMIIMLYAMNDYLKTNHPKGGHVFFGNFNHNGMKYRYKFRVRFVKKKDTKFVVHCRELDFAPLKNLKEFKPLSIREHHLIAFTLKAKEDGITANYWHERETTAVRVLFENAEYLFFGLRNGETFKQKLDTAVKAGVHSAFIM